MARVPVQVIAHRGSSFDSPENTPAAFEEALRQGCDGIELDLQLTLDHVPVVYHDKNLARLGMPDRQVADLTWAELRSLSPAPPPFALTEDERIPTMEDVLRRFGDRTHLLLEVKTREPGAAGRLRHVELMQRTLRAVETGRLRTRVSILSYDLELLGVCAREAPHLPRVLNIRSGLILFAKVRKALAGLAALAVNIRTLTPAYAAAVRKAGCPLLVFVCNDIDQVNLARAVSSIGIMSDRPGWLRTVLEPPPILEPQAGLESDAGLDSSGNTP